VIKRLMDIVISCVVLVLASPLILIVAVMVWAGDRHNPFYVAPRVGRNGVIFQMIKFRSMKVGADRSGVDSTAGSDARITHIGRLIRKTKLDELPQLINVLRGEMSLVGPRPNVEREVRMYTAAERGLLSVRPGITDLASIVFSDEGDILDGSPDPDLLYNQIIRPWKSQLGLIYVERQTFLLDIKVLVLTIVNSLSRSRTLEKVAQMVHRETSDAELTRVVRRTEQPPAAPPPGETEIVSRRPEY